MRSRHREMADPLFIRTTGLMLPVGLTLALAYRRRPNRRESAGAFLAAAWAFAWLLPANLLAFHFGWWSFDVHEGQFLGVPVDLWLGWALFWGAIPLLAFPRVPLWAVAA